jgi:hypothetical protein
MRRALVGVVAMAVAVAVGASAGAAGASSAFSCKVKRFKVDGHAATTACGPATATLTVSGRTYSFKNGECSISKGSGRNRAVYLALGTGIDAPSTENQTPKGENDGYPYFTLTTMGTIATVLAVSHGKLLTGTPGPSTYTFAGKYKGTFTSHSDVTFSGSWDCHGVSITP